MTLRQFLDYLNENPMFVIAYLVLIPFAAFLAGVLGKGEGHMSPWKYLYSVIVYLVCIPGIFAITFNIYNFLFERGSIMNAQLNTQILPVFSMILTLFIIKRNVSLDYIPGFGKLSGLIMMIAAVICFMWFFDRVRLFVFSYMPIQQLLLIFIALIVLIRIGWSRAVK